MKPKTEQLSLGSVEETERLIREQFNAQPEIDFKGLKMLIEQEKYSAFFESFDKMNLSAEHYLQKHKNICFKKYLENKGGTAMSEKYSELMQQIQIEKYSPFTTKEHLQDLISQMEILYRDFS